MKTATKGIFLMAPLAMAALAGCESDATTSLEAADANFAHSAAGVHRQYGPPIRLGGGRARTYVVLDAKNGQAPVEVGVALDEGVMEGLPAEMSMQRLRLPNSAPAPYTFVTLDWNPAGHEPPGIYDHPHFDFHFYVVPEADVDAIVPTNPNFAAEANNLPVGDVVPPFTTVLMEPGMEPAQVAVPMMGVHWVDVRSPELQGVFGNPDAYEPFTKTFLYGSWDGQFTFLEPMITRAYLLSRPDEIIPISKPADYEIGGWYPGAYKITYDVQAREYRIALTDFARHD